MLSWKLIVTSPIFPKNSHLIKMIFEQEELLREIDMIVDFKDIDVNDYADNYFDFKFSLQEILNRPVDLLEEHAIKNTHIGPSYSLRFSSIPRLLHLAFVDVILEFYSLTHPRLLNSLHPDNYE